LKYVK